MDELKKQIEAKRKAFKRFDAMTPAEQRAARERGEDPHESKAIREKRKAAALEKRKREFDKLPKKQRDILTAIGWSPYQVDKIVNRSTDYFNKNGTFVID